VLDRHRRRLGLRADPHGDRIHASPYLTVMPEAMEAPADPGPSHALRFREAEPASLPLPRWWGDDERPLVYVTYGSVRPTFDGFPALFARTVDALAELPVRVLFTVGNEIALEPLGPVPANVRVERWVAQAAVMPHAAAMVGHGGAGTTRTALAAGVPAVVVPGFADQPRNAERVDALGAGIGLAGEHEVPTRLADAVMRVIGERSYREVARRVAAEVAALPTTDAAPAALRDLAELPRAA
jgi:MGT family glycosyltransferase